MNELHHVPVKAWPLSARRNHAARGQDFAAPPGKGPFIHRVGEGLPLSPGNALKQILKKEKKSHPDATLKM